MTTIVFLIVLAILIFVHELGHFLFAKWSGMKVEEFAIGFPPKIFSFRKGETLYSINLIPFGGFVKILGENGEEDQAKLSTEDKKRFFTNSVWYKQLAVLFAGVLFNFIFAWILISISLASGSFGSRETYGEYVKEERVVVTKVVKDSPAEKAGLKMGDKILSVEQDKKIYLINKPEDLQMIVASSSSLVLNYSRSKDFRSATIAPVVLNSQEVKMIGINMDILGEVYLPFYRAPFDGFMLTINITERTAEGLYDFLLGFFGRTQEFKGDVAGPVGIASLIGEAYKSGLNRLMYFTAIISINLAVLNLVPFPALDGGRIFIVILETALRKKLNPKYLMYINSVGFIVLISLMVFVTFKDIVKIFYK